MTPQFIAAGVLAVVAASIHGAGGEILVLRKLFSGGLPSSRFGGAHATKAIIRVTWHIATLTFAVLGVALTTCGFLGSGDACRGIGLVGASSFTGYLVVVGLVVLQQPRRIPRHAGPLAFLAIAALAWWGTL